MDASVHKPKSNNEVMLFSRLDDAGYIVDMVEKKEPKSY
jgi:hypothetical protein